MHGILCRQECPLPQKRCTITLTRNHRCSVFPWQIKGADFCNTCRAGWRWRGPPLAQVPFLPVLGRCCNVMPYYGVELATSPHHGRRLDEPCRTLGVATDQASRMASSKSILLFCVNGPCPDSSASASEATQSLQAKSIYSLCLVQQRRLKADPPVAPSCITLRGRKERSDAEIAIHAQAVTCIAEIHCSPFERVSRLVGHMRLAFCICCHWS